MSDSDNSSDGESANRNKSKSKIPDGFEIESLQEYEDLKKKSHDKVQGKINACGTVYTVFIVWISYRNC